MVPNLIEIALYCITSKKSFAAGASYDNQGAAVVEYLGFAFEYVDSKIIVFNKTLVYYAF